MDLARIASGRVEMRKVLVSVQNLVDGVVAEQQPVAQNKNVQLLTEISPLAPQTILADPERLGLVFPATQSAMRSATRPRVDESQCVCGMPVRSPALK